MAKNNENKIRCSFCGRDQENVDKLIAGNTPNLGKADVVFSTDAALEIYGWFAARMNSPYWL